MSRRTDEMRLQLKVSYNSLAYKYNVLYEGETTERREGDGFVSSNDICVDAGSGGGNP